eukprot:TRINITY_DN682_c0_g1_i1.p4 TRINITY_DN682_c0_g1~~TRINITY_DN682_c0_g1_i1.p4  ORF type:complete len:65 (+),score=23.51 TRINITY_DN682_c0_g1_i1:386-580(+)
MMRHMNWRVCRSVQIMTHTKVAIPLSCMKIIIIDHRQLRNCRIQKRKSTDCVGRSSETAKAHRG